EGPYLLGGYSLGGLIALEMARLLIGRGAPVAAVVMFDTYPAGLKIKKDIDFPDHIWKHMVANMFLLEGRLPEDALEGVPEALHETRLALLLSEHGRTILPADQVYRYLRGAFAVSAHHREALRRFQPSRLDGVSVLYFRATRGLDGRPVSRAERARRTSFWQGLIERPMRVVDLDADHFELMAARHHPVIRDEIGRLVDAAPPIGVT
ncbi:MAG: thioesterase domain-containing protein, partial [Byssovorax sp.]